MEQSEEFQSLYLPSHDHSWMTRTDVLMHESLLIHRETQNLVHQYEYDVSRFQENISEDIASMRNTLHESQDIVYPERAQVEQKMLYVEQQLNLDRENRPETLAQLALVSRDARQFSEHSLEQAEKKIVLQDIESLQHEIRFVGSFYRVNDEEKLSFEENTFQKLFDGSFSEEHKEKETANILREKLETVSNLLEPYRMESQELRKIAQEKRASVVAQETEKWPDGVPKSPIPDVYQLIYVSLSEQRMYAYEDGELILSTYITSGKQNFETIRGTFKVYTKQRGKLMKSPFPDIEYELWVDYWLGFSGAYGIHDSCNSRDCWRTKFGGSNYVWNGSHGCVNTPYNSVKFIYNWARIGTTVYVK